MKFVHYSSQVGELINQAFFFVQAYIARLPGSPSGFVAWQMDFTDCDLVIDTITIATQSVTTESGRVEWTLEGDGEIEKNITFSDSM